MSLNNDLYLARRAIVTLLPQPIQELINTYRSVETHHQVYEWEGELVEAIIEIARPLATETLYSGPRAACPLCHGKGLGPYMDGFLIPGGLRMHLLGEANAQPCSVLTPVLELARDSWLPRIHAAEERERAATEAEKELRREREAQFLVDPNSAPVLRDEPVRFQFHFNRETTNLSHGPRRASCNSDFPSTAMG